jgi:hypothetical protein
MENEIKKMGSSEQIEQGRRKEDEPIEVSYTILRSVNQRNRSDIIQGHAAQVSSAIQEATGRKPVSFSQFVNDYAEVFR